MKSSPLRSVHFLLPLLLALGAPLAATSAEPTPANPQANAPASALLTVEAAGVSPEWLTQARANYPLTTCVVSDEKLEGSGMGGPKDFVYRVEGKPDQLVRFCCASCVKDFKADPAKHLAIITHAKPAK